MQFRKAQTTNVDEENPYWMSFSDIMSALLVIFIMASVILILQLMEIQKELEHKQAKFEEEIVALKQAEQVRRTILDEAVETLRKRGIKVEVSQNHTVLSIPNELLGFETGAFDISPTYQSRAREIGEVLNMVISRDNRVEFLDILRATNANDFLHTFRTCHGKARYGRPIRERRLFGLLFFHFRAR
ncbi:hypothetical protein SJT37_13665 [Aeromonas caviae]|uniref:hypothetical protein n=1 Tax=Aeromonas caviae TaxID=648 RepID=UPI0029D48C2D|nr:hypothetical protein [Aeromonas caviae]MDX7676575.1 hypothetical protein [Aeromonas caviae]